MRKLYSEETYDVYEKESGELIAVCTQEGCNCQGFWVLQEAPTSPSDEA